VLRRLTSSDNDVDLEVIAFGSSIVVCKIAILPIDIVGRQLLLPLLHSITILVAVVLRGNDDPSLFVGEVRDNVSPSLIVVDAQSDDEVFTSVAHETKRAACPAAANGEHVGSVNVAPFPAVGVVPNRLLDDVEVRVWVGVVDPSVDFVSHSVGNRQESG
jgi:hypothetical protein